MDIRAGFSPAKEATTLLKNVRPNILTRFFLDIALPGFNGLETAERLLEIQKDAVLVFVSNQESMVFSSYEYHPFWFVPKSQMKLLEIVTEKVIEKIDSCKNEVLKKQITMEKKLVEVNFHEIAYFENSDHYVRLVSKSGEVSNSYREKLGSVEAQLKENWFVRCHSRYLVNCRMISYIEASACELLNHEKIPISRKRMNCTKTMFQEYLRSIR